MPRPCRAHDGRVQTGDESAVSGYPVGMHVDYLRQVRVLDVSEVRYWPVGEASVRFGVGHPGGVIELIRR